MSVPIDDRALMREALQRIEELQARLRDGEGNARAPIAIVGMSCRFPGAVDLDAFWQLLERGGDAIRDVPPDRWDADAYYDPDPDAPGKIYTRRGGFLEGLESFDAAFFGLSPREAASLDPQQRLLLETSWEALEHAAIPPDSLAGTAGGVFVGIGGVDYYQRLTARDASAIDAYMASGNAHSTASGRLSYLLGLHGPSFSVDTACSSSLVALHLACRSLRAHECDLALAAGVNVILSPAVHINHCRSRMLAPDGRCKAFDAAADGFIRSEGCGLLVLKRHADAVRDGDRILAVVRGSAINQDGRTSALTVPNGRAQQAVVRAALKDAGVNPRAISYVEAHGTGTALGDPIEVAALGNVFAGRETPLSIGSVKANIGHAEAAAGVAGVIKVVLAMQHRTLPPQQHFHTPNPLIPWPTLPLHVVTAASAWDASGATLFAGVSGFGFGGTNAHVVLESAPSQALDAATSGRELLVISARTAAALRSAAAAYAPVVAAADRDRLAAICTTTTIGRTHFEHRAALVADDPRAAAARLQAVADGRTAASVWHAPADGASDGRIVFVYPGQGAAYAGMMRGLWTSEPAFREALEACAAALSTVMDRPLADVLFGADAGRLLAQTRYAQPAIWAVETALTRWWAHVGVEPAAVVGHSVGELAALTAAGVLSIDDAARFVTARSLAMQAQPTGAMTAIAGPVDDVAALVAQHSDVSVAAINGPAHVVVAGTAAAVAALEEEARGAGWSARPLDVGHPFHSALMDDALADVRASASTLTVGAPLCAVVSTLTGAFADALLGAPDYWVRQARQPVQFAAAIGTLWNAGYRIFVEAGPSAGLTALGRACVDDEGTGAWVQGLQRRASPSHVSNASADVDQLRASVAQVFAAGGRIDWRAWERSRRSRVVLPAYPFERRRYWVDAPAAQPASPADRASTYVTVWEPVDAAGASRATHGSWIVVGRAAAAIADAWRSRGVDVRSIQADADPEAAVAAAASGDGLAGVVCAGALDDATDASGSRLPQVIADECLRVVPWIAALNRLRRQLPRSAPRLWIATRGGVAVAPGDPAATDRGMPIAQAPLWGFGRVVALEHPDVWGGLVDLDPRVEIADGLLPWIAAAAGAHVEDQIAVRDGRLLAPRLEPAALPHGRAALRASSTYLVTGGTGGLGLQVAEWMVDRGAGQIVLVSRRPPAPSASARIDQLRARAAVHVVHADVAQPDAMARVVEWIGRDLPPLRGVIHAAGVNGSAAVDALDRASFEQMLSAKTAGAWALHEATHGVPLDFFVLFSSIASVWGSKDQAEYAAANAFLDQLAERRRRVGLPALSIAWGPWSGDGMATPEARAWLDRAGVRTMAAPLALDILGRLLDSSGQRVVADIDWDRFLEIVAARRPRPFFDRLRPTRPAPPDDDPAPATVAADIVAQGSAGGRRALLRLVTTEVLAVLHLDAASAPAPRRGFFTIGFDSLTALELRHRLARALAAPLPSTLAFDYPNIHELSEYLAREVLRLDDDASSIEPSSPVATPSAAAASAGAADVDAAVAQALRRLERALGTS